MNRFQKLVFSITLIPAVFFIFLGGDRLWVMGYVYLALFVLLAAGKMMQMKRNRPDMGIMEQLRLDKELRMKNQALLKQMEPEDLPSCILARRELVKQAVGVDRIVYTMNLAERLIANADLDEAARILDSIVSELEGSVVKSVYWYNRIAIEMYRQNEEKARKLFPHLLEDMKRVYVKDKKQKLANIYIWQAVLEERYEQALLLIDEMEKNQEYLYSRKPYLLMERCNIYLKQQKMKEALETAEELKGEKRPPLIDWWLKQQGM